MYRDGPGFIEAYIQIQKGLGSRVIDGDDVVVKMNNGLLTFLSDRLTDEEASVCADNLKDFAEFSRELGAVSSMYRPLIR